MRSAFGLTAAVVVMLLAGCGGKQPAGHIEDHLERIVSNRNYNVSSNPHTYIANEPDAYRAIVSGGEASFAYLTERLRNGDANGLKQWVMAKACQDILGDRSPVKQWVSGKDWIKQYDERK